MAKPQYLLAVVCYLLIPLVLVGGGGLFVLIDPEWARGQAHYERDYHTLGLVRHGVLMAAGGVALLLSLAVSTLVLRSRQRSLGWLVLAAAGPLGFSLIAMLEDTSPDPQDRYQRFIRSLPVTGRVALELALFVTLWSLAFAFVILQRELKILVEAVSTETPAASIIVRQDASSGMWAFAEGLAVGYLVVLIELLWPLVFNGVARWRGSRRCRVMLAARCSMAGILGTDLIQIAGAAVDRMFVGQWS